MTKTVQCVWCGEEHSFEVTADDFQVDCDCGAKFNCRLIEFWTPPVKKEGK